MRDLQLPQDHSERSYSTLYHIKVFSTPPRKDIELHSAYKIVVALHAFLESKHAYFSKNQYIYFPNSFKISHI